MYCGGLFGYREPGQMELYSQVLNGQITKLNFLNMIFLNSNLFPELLSFI